MGLVMMLALGVGERLSGQEGRAGTRPIVQEVGPGARAFGLGRAFVALADDPTAVFWNPAGLEFVPKMTFSLYHMPLIAGATYDFAGFVYPTLQFGTVGLGYARVGVGGIPVTDAFNIVHTDNATFEDSEIYISYARRLFWGITPGLTFKVQRQAFSFNNQVTSAFGLDVGLMYHPPFESPVFQGLTLGIHVQNALKPQLKLGPNDDPQYRLISVGFKKSLQVGISGRVNVVLNYVQGELEGGSIRAGAEYLFRDMGTIRLGFDENTPAFGGGVRYKFVQIDYSFGNLSFQGDFPATHRFSVTFHLGKSREEKIRIAEEERKRRERELVERTREEERQRRVALHMAKGKEYLEQGNYFDARSEFQLVIAEDPLNQTANALFDSVETLIQKQFEARQQEAIARAVDKEREKENQRLSRYHFERGQLRLEKNRFTEALIEFNLALEYDPENPTILDAIKSTNRRMKEAVQKLLVQARQEFEKGNLSDALKLLSDARVLAPEDPQLKEQIDTLAKRIKFQQYFQQGLVLFNLGDYEKALKLFEEALRLDPSNQAIQEYIDRSRLEMGTQAEKMDPESTKKFYQGMDRFLAGDYEEALKIWKELARKYPYNKQLRNAIKTAEEYIQTGKQKQQ